LAEFWAWWPAFRAVAETESLRRASEKVHTSASALSRQISLIEDQIGVQLFAREGRGLRLTRNGQVLLDAVRVAMRLLDEGLVSVPRVSFSGPFRVMCPPHLASMILRGIHDLRMDNEGIVPQLVTSQLPSEELNARLHRGELDAAVVYDHLEDDRLQALPIMSSPCQVYCCGNHPFVSAMPSAADIQSQPFVGLGGTLPKPSFDGWPMGVDRRRAAMIEDVDAALDACRVGQCLIALPEIVVALHPRAHVLHPLEAFALQPVQLRLLRRRLIADDDVVQDFMRRLQYYLPPVLRPPLSTPQPPAPSLA